MGHESLAAELASSSVEVTSVIPGGIRTGIADGALGDAARKQRIGELLQRGAAPESVEQEARLVMDGIKAKVELAGLTMDDVVQVQIFCPDLSLYEQFNEVYKTYFDEHFPARAFIGSGSAS